MPEDREVGGIRCSGVLTHLSSFVDGELEAVEVTQIEEHLRGCDWCRKFGGEYAGVVQRLQEKLSEPESLDEDVEDRLWQRLRGETSVGDAAGE